MAKKTEDEGRKTESAAAVEVAPVVTPIDEGVEVVSYSTLISSKVRVQDTDGNVYYLEPSRHQGEFVLRVMPKAA